MRALDITDYPRSSRALVLCDGDLSSEDQDVAALLDFFGIPWSIVSIPEFATTRTSPEGINSGKCRVLTSAPVLAKALLGERSDLPWPLGGADSVYVYGFQRTDSEKKLLRFLADDTDANIRPLSKPTAMSVTNDLPEMCGAMSGLTVMPAEADQAFELHRDGAIVQRIISTADGDTFVSVPFQGVPFYLNASRKTIQIHSPAREPFDVKKVFAGAVPITMYLRWAFADVCWRSSETSACLIVDDPLLRPQHGFLAFRRALELMDKHDFTMSLAFIPWNWRRTHPDVVRLFQERSDKFSLSVHGCDHIAGEFATHSLTELNARTKLASQRMESLHKRTSLKHDRIMIFPQGAFSAEAGRVLKLNGFVAAVNTEVAPSADSLNETEVADLWDVAITKYGTFPLFTRRYCAHGIENFAFDILLGKPCLLVAHHQDFQEDGRNLMECIDRLNSLHAKLFWRSLGDAVRRSFRIRGEQNATTLQMYGNQVHIENPCDESRTIEFIKEENDPDFFQTVIANQQIARWSFQARSLRLNVTIPPRSYVDLQTVYRDAFGQGVYPHDLRYTLKTAVRRYLCEARDNYLAKSGFWRAQSASVRN